MKKVGMFFLILFVLGGTGYILTRIEEPPAVSQQAVPASRADQSGEGSRPITDEWIKEGMKAPDFELRTLDGRIIKLSALRGRPVLVTFWNTSTPTCADEMLELVSFYRNGRPPELEMLAINVTKTESSIDDVKSFTARQDIPFPVLLDTEMKVQEAYQAVIIPSSFLVDQKGMIHKVFVEPLTTEALQKAVQSL